MRLSIRAVMRIVMAAFFAAGGLLLWGVGLAAGAVALVAGVFLLRRRRG